MRLIKLGFASLFLLALAFTSFADKTGQVSVIVPVIKLHVSPTAESDSHGLASKGQLFTMDAESGSFYRIQNTDGSTGWISKDAVAIIKPMETTPAQPEEKTPPASPTTARPEANIQQQAVRQPQTATIPASQAGFSATTTAQSRVSVSSATALPDTVWKFLPAVPVTVASRPTGVAQSTNQSSGVASPHATTGRPPSQAAGKAAGAQKTAAAEPPQTSGFTAVPAPAPVPGEQTESPSVGQTPGGTKPDTPALSADSAPKKMQSEQPSPLSPLGKAAFRPGMGVARLVALFAAALIIFSVLLLVRRKRAEPLRQATPPATTGSALEGKLAGGSLIDILQFINDTRKSGCLQVENLAPLGIVYFAQGRIIHAAAIDRAYGLPAVNYLLGLKEGRFRFVLNKFPRVRDVDLSTMEVLMKWTKAQDEAHRH